MYSDENSIREIIDAFKKETRGLENLIQNMISRTDRPNINEIIQIYYNVINVSSMIKVIKNSNSVEEDILEEVRKAEGQIHEQFNLTIHEKIMTQLSQSIVGLTNDLKNERKTQDLKVKEDIEIESKLYDKLREMMSTKEFVLQYNKEINDESIS